jgi:tetratricopeptide (TPR) repeat protein
VDAVLAGQEDDTITLDALHNFGTLYRNQSRLDEAEEMYERALQGREKALGPDHTSTLQTVNNLGLLYADQGRLDEAGEMYKRALQGYEKRYGSDHPRCRSLYRALATLEECVVNQR